MKISKKKLDLYKIWVRMARAKRDVMFKVDADKYKKMYKGEQKRTWGGADTVKINLVYANIEISKPSIFFRNPRIYVRPKKDVFILEKGGSLDGAKAARLIEDGVRYIAYTQELEEVIRKVRDDALILKYGIVMVGYEGEFGLSTEDDMYVVADNIYITRISPYNFLVDPEATDQFAFSDARWVAREYEAIASEVKKDPYYENTEDLKPDVLGYSEIIKRSKGSSSRSGTSVVTLLDTAGRSFKNHPDAQRITLIEMWIKPTPAEKRKLKEGSIGGKLVVFSMGSDKAHKANKWPYKIKGFPFRGLGLTIDNDEFYPIHEVKMYEGQVAEKEKLRTYQLQAVKVFGQRKILINKDAFDSEEDIEKVTNPEAGPFIFVNGEPSKVAAALQWGSVPADMFMVDKKVDEDIDKISGISDIRRGIPPPGMETATEGKLLYASGGFRFVEKRGKVVRLYKEIARLLIQLMKQFWTTETVIRRLGTLTPEWTDKFSNKDIQIEDDVEIDAGEMVPTDDAVVKKQAIDLLDRVTNIVKDPNVRTKLMLEGYKVNLHEAIKEVFQAFNIKNEKIIEKTTPQEYLQVLLGLMMQQQKEAQSKEMVGGPGGPAGAGGAGRPRPTGTPTGTSIANQAGVRRPVGSPDESVGGMGI